MVKKRWGKKFIDNRNWRDIDKKYISRGEYLLNPEFLETWNDEIGQLNRRKIGEPFMYPNSLIEFAGYFHARGFNYRECEGILKSLSKNYKYEFPVISFSQFYRRLNKLEFSFEVIENNLICGVDGTGEKTTNGGDWRREKHGGRKDWIKVTILGKQDGTIADIRIGNSKQNERSAARGLVRQHHKKIKKIQGDGAHENKAMFDLCENYNIETAIKIRKNAQTHALGSPRRKWEVVEYKKLGYKKWAKEKEYGFRWVSTEGIFSAKKRIFGETVRAKKKRSAYKEVRRKYWFYNKLQGIG
jgi:hypothetical protein